MSNQLLAKANHIATEVHKSATDKYGAPYIRHITRVMNMGTTEDEKICGILHDIAENTL